MNSSLVTLDPVTVPSPTRIILSKNGFTAALITLAAGEETPPRGADDAEEHLLFVVEGQATVRFDEVNTIVDKDEALLIPQGKNHVISAMANRPAKVLRVEVPPRQVVEAPIISPER